MELNKLANATAINAACWNEEGELDLYTAQRSKTSGSHSAKEKVSPHSVKVKSVELDNILGSMRIEKVNFIKIDVEGAEVEVLEGAQKTIAKSDSLKILFEAHNQENLEKCQEILKGHKTLAKPVYCSTFLASKP
jgi:FkbM family methyltransferase